MPTVIDLCNMALGKIAAGRISTLTEAKNEAVYCNLYYAHTRDEVLRGRDWKCATRTQSLAQESTTPLFDWNYQYQLPEDPKFLRLIAVSPKSSYERNGDKLLSDEIALDLKYVAQLTDPEQIDPDLAEAIITRLASKLATSVANKPNLAKLLFAEYMGMVQLASEADGADSSGDDIAKQQDEDPNLITSR